MEACHPVEVHAAAVYRYVRRRLFPAVDSVEDLVQEVLLAAWKGRPGHDAAAPLQSWVLGIAKHKVDDHYRHTWTARRTEIFDHLEPAIWPNFERSLTEAQETRQIEATLNQLPDEYRTVLLQRYWRGRSAAEMAAHLGRTEKAVERLLARARSQFRQLWVQTPQARSGWQA